MDILIFLHSRAELLHFISVRCFQFEIGCFHIKPESNLTQSLDRQAAVLPELLIKCIERRDDFICISNNIVDSLDPIYCAIMAKLVGIAVIGFM